MRETKNYYLEDDDFIAMWLLATTREIISKARNRELASLNVEATAEQAGILFCVKASKEPPTPAAIARCVLKESQTVSGLLKRMRERGLLEKSVDPDRRNWARIALTQKGEEAFKKSIERKAYHRFLSVLSSEERRQLRSILGKLRDKVLEEMLMERPTFP